MVTEILQYIGDSIKLMPREADALYAGIIIDTNNFLNETGSRTFEAAAFLRRNGADVTRVRKKLRDDMSNFKAKAEAVKNAVTEGAYAFAICPSQGLDSPTVTGAQVANELLNIKGVEAAFVCTQVNDTVYISARSLETMNVQLVMERFGGGGHTTVAGAQIKDKTAAAVLAEVKDAVKAMKSEGDL
jgi:c-di-AMP phosphodiesterase-like protein